MIGRPIRRVEDRPLLTGRAEFVDDLRMPGMLHAAFLRSPFAHARLLAIEPARARSLPGIVAILTGSELPIDIIPPITAPNAFSPPRPVLAREIVRFVGEPVAVVVATNRSIAEDAIELLSVEYDPLDVVADASAAMAPGAPRLHAVAENVLFSLALDVGEVDAAMAASTVVVEATFRNPRLSAAPIECRGVVAAVLDGVLTLWSSTQAPHRTHSLLAELFKLDMGHIRVIATDVGGGFGQKAHTYPEEVVLAALALQLGRPVKWIEDRLENLMASSHARDQVVWARAAADAEGRLLAIEADVVCDTGAYGVFPHGHVLEALGTLAMIPGPYRVPAYRARARSIATNKCPEGAYRGVGLPVSTFVHERLMDMLAHRLELDRAEIRRRNFVRTEDFPYTTATGQCYDSGDYARALDMALAAVGYEGFPAEQAEALAGGRRIGLGISSYVEYSGMGSAVFHSRGMVGISGQDGAYVILDSTGRVTAWTTTPGIGQGVGTSFAQIVASELSLPIESIRIARSDTGVGGISGTGSFASRSAISGGGALMAACRQIRQHLCDDGAQRLEADPQDLTLEGGWVRVAGVPSRGVPFGELVAAAEPDRYRVSASFDPPHVAYPYATHACVVEVDLATGEVRILRYTIAEDCGTVINPLIVEGQVHGATAQGIGGTLYESIVYDQNGQLQTGSLMDYLLPTAGEIPNFSLSHLEIPSPCTPNGAKGVGEGGTLAPPGAIANAVADALGIDFNELPLTPDRIRAAIRG